MVTKILLKTKEEWRKNRTRLGGSDAAAVLGENPFMSNVDLWEIKTGLREQEDISEKPYVKYGTEAEEHLRALFALDFPQYEVLYEENNLYLNDRYPFAHASLDGVLVERETGRKGVLEIKTTNILRSMQKEKWDHRIPQNYFAQVLHYLMVTELEFAVLKAQLRYDFGGDIVLHTRHYLIERSDVEADIRYLAEQEKLFWDNYVIPKRRPDRLLPEI